jgi:hypothetical protein
MKTFLTLLAIATVVVGCATFEPQMGMSYQKWRSEWATSSTMAVPELVAAQGNTRIYKIKDTFYYFTNDRLTEIDQGQLADRIAGEERKKRYQMEIIRK